MKDMNNLNMTPSMKPQGTWETVATHTETTKLGKFVFGGGVINVDLDLLGLSQGNIEVKIDSKTVKMQWI